MILSTISSKDSRPSDAEPLGEPKVSAEQLLSEAVAVADLILRHQARSRDGHPAWRGPTGYGTPWSPLRCDKLGPHLYQGTTGIAFFLAALGHVTAQSQYAEIALSVLAPLRKKLRALTKDPERAREINLSIGGLMGLGSFIYSFTTIGKWLDEPSLIHEAHEATVLITPERIARDDRVRVQTGSAGAILALLALQKVLPEPNSAGRSPLDLARACALRLLETRVSYEGRPRAWVLSPNKPPLLGFCYGAAGGSFALLKLFETSPEPEVWEAALEGWDYLGSFYRPRERQWTDIRALLRARFEAPGEGSWGGWWLSGTKSNLAFPLKQDLDGEEAEDSSSLVLANKWCHGAPGILMARLATRSLLDTPEIRDEVDGALQETRWFAEEEKFSKYPADDLCCGHMGRVEALLYASRRLADESLLKDALVLADRVVRRAQERGTYTVTAARGTDHFSPSLFQGYGGIGYTLLRLARPEALPCLLLME